MIFRPNFCDDPAKWLTDHAAALTTPELGDKFPPGTAAGDAVQRAAEAMKHASKAIDEHQACTADTVLPLPW